MNTAKLKAAALAAGGEEWVPRDQTKNCGEYTVIVKGSLEKHSGWTSCRPVADEVVNKQTMKFIALANPAAVLELIAALEAKDAQIAELLEKQRLIDICQGQGLEHRIAAERRAEAAEKRVAELERQAIQPLPIGELINRLEEQTGEPWGEVYLAGINLRRGENEHG